ncbi:hypothetical protein [Ruminococcus gauvreauii]|uniref:rolling circle replication-associated protein n=1 Tax=Ruminococcus gauvreauii TaxID=438033 RepID=UPI0039844131
MYNVRLKHFQDGEVQTRIYSHGVNSGYARSSPEKSEMVVEPFTNTKVRVVTSFTEEEKRKEECLYKSMKRAKQKIYDVARANIWEYFVTLTFNPDRVDRYDYSACTKKLAKWLDNTKQRVNHDFKYLVVPELHKDGAYHFHGLIANCEGLQIVPSGHLDARGNVIYNINSYDLGFTTATKVQENAAVTKYITKYTTKELCQNSKGKKKYWASRNCDLPLVEDYWLDTSDKEMLHEELIQDVMSFKTLDYMMDVRKRQVSYYENKGLTLNVELSDDSIY